MDVSKYKSVTEWRDDLNAQGWNISITAGWALQQTMKALGLCFQEAMDFLVRNEKLAFSGRTVLTDLSFPTLLAEVQTIKRSFELSTSDGEGEAEKARRGVLEDTKRRREAKRTAVVLVCLVLSGIIFARSICAKKETMDDLF